MSDFYDYMGVYYSGDSYDDLSDEFSSALEFGKPWWAWEYYFSPDDYYVTDELYTGFHNLPYIFFNATGAVEVGSFFLETYNPLETSTWKILSINNFNTTAWILLKVTLDGNPLSGVTFGGATTDENGEVFIQTGVPYTLTYTPIKEGYSFDPVSVSYTNETRCVLELFSATDLRPSKAITPAPANTATNVTLDQAALTWVDGGGATSYDVYYGDTSGDLTLVSEGQAGTSFTVSGISLGSPYKYLTTRYWRIDSTNDAGTTTGDEWSFTTMRFSAPAQTYWSSEGGYYYRLLIDGSGDYGDHPADGGVEDTDYEVLAGYSPNFMATTRVLVGAANNKLWFEDL